MFQAIRNYVSPLPAVDVRSVHGDDGYWVLVIVPPSLDSPHAVTGPQGDGKLSFPRRHGSDTLWLTEHEVADAYRQRFSGQDALAANRERVIAAELKALEASEDMWLWVCALADRPAAGRLDTATAAAIDAWWDGGDVTPLGRSIGRGDSLPAPGRLTFPDFAWSHDDVLNPREGSPSFTSTAPPSRHQPSAGSPATTSPKRNRSVSSRSSTRSSRSSTSPSAGAHTGSAPPEPPQWSVG